MQYYSTFPTGFLPLVEEILLSKDKGIQVINKGEEYIHYSTSISIEDIRQYEFFEQSILILKFFNKETQFSNLIHWIKSNESMVKSKLSVLGESVKYRVVGTSINLDKNQIQEEIDAIEYITYLDKKAYGYDLRVVHKEEYAYIGVRITNPKEYIDDFQKGSLRREIAYYMLYLSEMDKGDIFLDPYCGSGIIPILRSRLGEYQKVYGSDIDISKVKSFDGEVIESDINDLDIKVNKIVTDPPWGFIEDIDNLKEFYSNMLDRFYQLTYPKSLIVILTPHLSIIEEYISDRFVLIESYKGRVSGKESYIVKLKRS